MSIYHHEYTTQPDRCYQGRAMVEGSIVFPESKTIEEASTPSILSRKKEKFDDGEIVL